MKKKLIYALFVTLSVTLGMTSCLKNDDDDSTTLYDDMAITSFSISAVNRTMHTTASTGADSTYISKLTSNLPVFSIDQYKQQIYNTTPLPENCDLKHVVASIGAKNNGTILFKSITSDSLLLYTSTDSLDLSQPRELRVYALDGSGYRTYRLTVSMSTGDENTIHWDEADAQDAAIPQSLYQDVKTETGGEGTFRLSTDGGSNWTVETLGADEDASLLPTTDVAHVTFPYSAAADIDCEMLVGSSDNDTRASVVWRKIVEKGSDAPAPKWVNIPVAKNNTFYLPKTALSLVWFNSGLYAISSDGTIYKSLDQGITWNTTTDITLPEALGSGIKAATDTAGNLWLLSTDSGKVWRGHITQ